MNQKFEISYKIAKWEKICKKAVVKQASIKNRNPVEAWKRCQTLFNNHVEYLLRMTKTLANKDQNEASIEEFARSIEKWYNIPLCHEIALNRYFSADIEAHQHPLGKEAEYSRLCPFRDARVKLIWLKMWRILLQNPSLKGFTPYSEEETFGVDELLRYRVFCPVCGALVSEVVYTVEGEVPELEDNSLNFCSHVVFGWNGGFSKMNDPKSGILVNINNFDGEKDEAVDLIFKIGNNNFDYGFDDFYDKLEEYVIPDYYVERDEHFEWTCRTWICFSEDPEQMWEVFKEYCQDYNL